MPAWASTTPWFFDDRPDRPAAEGQGFSNLDLDDSWGLAYQLGMDYMLTDNVMLNAQVRYIDIDTKGTTALRWSRSRS